MKANKTFLFFKANQWITCKELITLLNGVIKDKKTVLGLSKKNGWKVRQSKGLGGVHYEFEIASLPVWIRNKIKQKQEQCNLVAQISANLLKANLYSYNKDSFIIFVNQLCSAMKTNQEQTLAILIEAAEWGFLAEDVLRFLNSLKSRIDTKGYKFLRNLFFKTPKKAVAVNKELIASNLSSFLQFYQCRSNPTVAEAWRAYKEYAEARGEDYRSYQTVRQTLNKLPDHIREFRRKTGGGMKSMKTYVRRNWETLRVNDCWAGDGHALHAKVKHPITGKAFRPEITLIIDCHSRFVVGWSVSLAENSIAIMDALRYGMTRYGVPYIYYSDNGAGQTNKTLDAEYTGILIRLGVAHEKAIAGNPQARGIIERLMRSLGKNIAKRFPTYFDKNTDKETTRKMLYAVESGARANAEGKELTTLQQKGLNILPTWEDLMQVMEEEIAKYNDTPHSAFNNKQTPKEVYFAGIEELKATNDFEELTAESANYFFKPAFVRDVRRAYITLMNGFYWAEKLEDYNGEKVICLVDIYDPKKITVETMEHRFICEAELDGNLRDAMPLPLIEQLQQRRKTNKQKKLDRERQDADLEAKRLFHIQAEEDLFSRLEAINDVEFIEAKSKKNEEENFLLKVLGINPNE